jgi:protein-S-isoprenylcysteine O-methyltransferase Ste14
VSGLELRVPPPLVATLCTIAMYGLSRIAPTWLWILPYATALALCVATTGLLVAVAGVLAFRRQRTTINPLHPEQSTALVTTGIYRHTRNPMYLGLLLVLLGFAIWLGNVLAPIMLVAFVLYLTRFQIVPEERVLREKFGEEYAGYMRRVRRWL